MTEYCDCCEGIGSTLPASPETPPGQAELAYRVGTHSSFLGAMLARLAELEAAAGALAAAAPASCLDEVHVAGIPGSSSDGARALLDAWACVADVLTFYQERIANEGYLRTATEERSVRELGRLLGYVPRPGMAAGVDVAFSVVNKDFDGTIPRGTKLQSLPRPGQDAQTFETLAPLIAKEQWNAMRPVRRSSGQYVRFELLKADNPKTPSQRIEIFVAGVDARIREGDLILLHQRKGPPKRQDLYRVVRVTPDATSQQTTLRLVPLNRPYEIGVWGAGAASAPRVDPAAPGSTSVERAGSAANATTVRDLPESLRPYGLRVLQARAELTPPRAHVFRSVAQPFGHNAPKKVTVLQGPAPGEEFSTQSTTREAEHETAEDENEKVVFLDGEYGGIKRQDRVVVVTPEGSQLHAVAQVTLEARSAYSRNGKVTRLELDERWWPPPKGEEDLPELITALRDTLFYVDADPLALLREPLLDPVEGGTIELDGAVEGLAVGRSVIVEGELVEPVLPGVRFAERVRVLASSIAVTADQLPTKDGATGVTPASEAAGVPVTRLHLSPGLKNRYKRDTVAIFGNVTPATHGETREQLLGSGDAAQPNQRFELQQGPRTWVSAATPAGIESTLEVRVSGQLWPEVSSFLLAGPRDQVLTVSSKSSGGEEVIGGDGIRGARFPTGVENLSARYRVGLGKGGNVSAGAITTLVTRPLGVSAVTNPLRASGGADPDGRDEMRARIPIVARGGEDRLVSVQDHAEFALNFSGIDKATAHRAIDRAAGRATVRVVVAGGEGEPFDADLARNLATSLHRYGDPLARVVVEGARGVPLFVRARVRVHERYEFAAVAPALRAALSDKLGWKARGIAEHLSLSTLLAAAHGVGGVERVDVEELRLAEPPPAVPTPAPATLEWRIRAEDDAILYFRSDRPDDIVLEEWTQ